MPGDSDIETATNHISSVELVEIAESKAKAAAERLQAVTDAAYAAIDGHYQETAKSIKSSKAKDPFTDKRSDDVIFKRWLEEPEFWLDKNDRAPPRPVLTEDEEREISRRVEIPTDQTPRYAPKHILSKEYGGTSNYEIGIDTIREEAEKRLRDLLRSKASSDLIARAKEDLQKLDCLYENYHIGMNVFRTAKGGREKIK